MLDLPENQRRRILLIGLGDVAQRILHILVTSGFGREVIVAGRSADRSVRLANLARYTAASLDIDSRVSGAEIDLRDRDRTMEALQLIQPDIIVNAASLLAVRLPLELPTEVFQELDEAQLGPFLPAHLALNRQLMLAVRDSDCAAIVVNAAFPDAVGPALASVGLAPHIGIGNVGNIVPPLTYAVAHELRRPVGDLRLRVVAQHYFSHHVHRFGEADGIPFLIEVKDRLSGAAVELDWAKVFGHLIGPLRRQGGASGQQLTAAAAVRVIRALCSEIPLSVHAPGPAGLVGGYPLEVSATRIACDLPEGITLDAAIRKNEACQILDGISSIEEGGAIAFAEPNMAVMRRLLGYECKTMRVEDSLMLADELTQKYRELVDRQRA